MKLYVGNLPFSATEADVRAFFAPTRLESVKICTDRETGRPRGFGFVEVGTRAEGEAAIDRLNGADVGGRRAVVNEANDKPRASTPPAQYDRREKPNFGRKPGSMDGWSGRSRGRGRGGGGGSRRRRDDYE